MTLDFASVTEDATEAALHQIISQTFPGLGPDWKTWSGRIGRENLRVSRRGGQILGGLAFYKLGQWFGGQPLPMAGIAGVAVAPEYRAAGIAAELMAAVLRDLYKQRIPISTLYASTQRLYRKVGYEHGGTAYVHRLPLDAIGRRVSVLPMHRVTADTRTPFEYLAEVRARATNGNLQRSNGMWERLFFFRDKMSYAYLIGDQENPQGSLVYYHGELNDHGYFDLHVRDMVAVTPQAAETLWSFFYGHRSMSDAVFWCGPANDPLLGLPGEAPFRVDDPPRWMLRIVDVVQALCLRGYPVGIEGELHLEIEDSVIPQNNGRFLLRVAHGQATVEPGGRGELHCGIGGLACLFSGITPANQLGMLGLLEGPETSIQLACGLFAGPEPWMSDMF